MNDPGQQVKPPFAVDEGHVSHVFIVRGRPVGFRPSRFGGELVATERGFFPPSATGYRSLAGYVGYGANAAPSDVSAEFLETLARNHDAERRVVLARARQVPKADQTPLFNFIKASMDAENAVNVGFFAPDAERVALWQAAYRVLTLIDANKKYQPKPDGSVWTPEYCAKELVRLRELQQFVQRLAIGDFTGEPPDRQLSARSYFELPARSGGEPMIALPSTTSELALDPSPSVPVEPEESADYHAGMAADSDDAPDAGAQMRLF
jgi:hypothetical protein